jgi:allophanate hydrolase
MHWSPETGSLDAATLRTAYAAGLSPRTVIEAVLARMAGGDDAVWITRVPADRLMAMADGLAARDPASLPLYGLPFAIKDNIDLAGVATTAACPAFARTPDADATVVARLIEAGAIPVGKTNLDQFATGLVGVRSPYGIPRNALDPDLVPGGSSSGSAVAVAAGLVTFALGTDTAGSGRVPAMFNNIVGLKPTKGLISTTGVLPACRSLDCVSIFAATVADALDVLAVAGAEDGSDPYSRAAPPGFAARPADLGPAMRLGVPRADQLAFFGNDAGAAVFAATLDRLRGLGATIVEIDYAPFAEAARLLYDGPWVAERTTVLEALLASDPAAVHPVVRTIVEAGFRHSALDAFRAEYALRALAKRTAGVWAGIDALVLPTAPRAWTVAEVLADPVAKNSALGTYTNFVNLLDLAALAVPAGFQADGRPFGVTLVAPAWTDGLLATIAARLEEATDLPLGASGIQAARRPAATTGVPHPRLPLMVVGAHMSGLPLNGELTALGARLRGPVETAPDYRFYALPGAVARPGLVRVATGAGRAIAGEVWDVPTGAVGALLARIPAPLGLGTVTLADGTACKGFVCEAAAVATATDITAHVGWRAYLAARAAG